MEIAEDVLLLLTIKTKKKERKENKKIKWVFINVFGVPKKIYCRSGVTYAPPTKSSNGIRRKSLCDVKCQK